MELTYDPFPLIFTRGDDATKLACLAFFGLPDAPLAHACLLRLIKQQRRDGAFPSQLDPDTWGTRETARHALLMRKLGLPPGGLNVHTAAQFIVQHQNADGGWCENPALEIPPGSFALSNERSMTWITADVVDLLRQAGMADHPAHDAALAWLREMQNPRGGWPSVARPGDERPDDTGDPDASAQITFLFGELYGEDDPTYRKGRALFEANLDACARDVARGYRVRARDGEREPPEVYHLTHLLLSWELDPPRRFQRGYDVTDPRVRKLMEALIGVQRPDGGWCPFWAEESSPRYTVLAVKALILSGILRREDLQAGVKTHAG